MSNSQHPTLGEKLESLEPLEPKESPRSHQIREVLALRLHPCSLPRSAGSHKTPWMRDQGNQE